MTAWPTKITFAGFVILLLTVNSAVAQPAPPVSVKRFNGFVSGTTIGVGGNTTMDILVSNPGTTTLTSVTFTDSIPVGIVISTPSGLLAACSLGSSLGPISAPAGGSTLSLGASNILAGGSCSVHVNVTGTAIGPVLNSVTATDAIVGAGNTYSAGLTVLPGAPPAIAKVFGAPAIPLNGTTSLMFTITAANALARVGFTDVLLPGLVVATPNGVSTTCPSGTVTANPGDVVVQLGFLTFAAAGSCTITVNVTGVALGVQNNTVQASDINLGAGNVATATLVVAAPPAITKTFADSQLQLLGPGDTTSLAFTITNPALNPTLTGIAFSDTLPSGLIVSAPNGLAGSCGGGLITAGAGSSSISLSGATLGSGASCTFSVNVTATAIGVQTNTTSPVSAFLGALVGLPATASTSVTDLFFLWFFNSDGGGNR